MYIKKSSTYLYSNARLNEIAFLSNFDFINQKVDSFTKLTNKNDKLSRLIDVKVKDIKGKR